MRQRFFHNGALRRLRDVVRFYATRDTAPQHWYPRAVDGSGHAYDDLPPQYQTNVNHDIPFRPLPGNKPRLSAAEIDAIVAFLNTLTDGYRPRPPMPAQVADSPNRQTALTSVRQVRRAPTLSQQERDSMPRARLIQTTGAAALAAASVAAHAQWAGLNNYVNVGIYSLPTQSPSPPTASSSLELEASAVTWNKDTNTLFMLGDGGGYVMETTLAGAPISL